MKWSIDIYESGGKCEMHWIHKMQSVMKLHGRYGLDCFSNLWLWVRIPLVEQYSPKDITKSIRSQNWAFRLEAITTWKANYRKRPIFKKRIINRNTGHGFGQTIFFQILRFFLPKKISKETLETNEDGQKKLLGPKIWHEMSHQRENASSGKNFVKERFVR